MRGIDVSTNTHAVNVLSPGSIGADDSKGVNLKNYSRAGFIVSQGTLTAPFSSVRVQQCTDSAGAGAVDIPFYYRRNDNSDGDDYGPRTYSDAGGIAGNANADSSLVIDVTDASLDEAGGTFVRVRLVGGTAVQTAIAAVLSGARYAAEDVETAL